MAACTSVEASGDPDEPGPLNEAAVSVGEWQQLTAMFAGRKRGRPAGREHVLSGAFSCERCGYRMYGMTRAATTPYPDGQVRRVYMCRADKTVPAGHGPCGRNTIDARTAEDAVAIAVQERLGDPRTAARMHAYAAVTAQTRARLAAEVATLEASADELAGRTASWGITRVDAAMRPILARLAQLDAELADLDTPEDADHAGADAVRAWNEASADGDHDALRAMVRQAFPRLALRPGRRGENDPARFVWDTVVARAA